jgi:bifunctional DNA-binding transcriptional regulator/antitoxin component of YhaV-PrlF toxin-antitoxin module
MKGQAMPVGHIVNLMERGQVTIPARYREQLGLTTETPLNVFEWRGMVVIVPVEFQPSIFGAKRETADWTRDTPAEYLKKVRYNPLEELWARMVRER